MHKIGITGGVGAGKSQVMAYLKNKYGAKVLLADEAAHILMAKDGVCYQPVLALLGPEVLAADGEFDKRKLAASVFGRPQVLQQLNAIVHPAVREYILDFFRREEEAGTEWAFLEAALLIEEKYDEICDELWYVYADESVRLHRLTRDRGYTEEKSRSVMASQLPEEEFRRHCAFVADNSGSLEDTFRQIDQKIASMT